MHSITPITTAEALEFQFRLAGFHPGIPSQVDERSRAIDAQLCRRMVCSGCRRRRMIYRPFTDGRRYRVLAACQVCGVAEEV